MTTATLEQPLSPQAHEEMMRRLQALVDGQLTAEEADELLNTISESDEWLQTADALWAENMARLEDIPALRQAQATKIEQRISNRLHRISLTGQIMRFGVQGFALVALALLRPFFSGTANRPTASAHHGNKNGEQYD